MYLNVLISLTSGENAAKKAMADEKESSFTGPPCDESILPPPPPPV